MLFWYSSLNELRQPSVYGLALCRGMPSSIILARFWGLSSLLWGYIFSRLWEPLDEGERGKWKSWFKTQHSKNKNHGIHAHHFMANRWGKSGNSGQISFSWVPKSLKILTATMKVKDVAPWKKSYDKTRQCIQKQRHYFSDKVSYSQSYGFSSSHVWMWELDHK